MASSVPVVSQNPLSKRQRFQPPITSFFAPAESTSSDRNGGGLSYNNYASPTHTPAPALPAKVQSSLLTVGMRIRKSVPEGYKTEQKKLMEYAAVNSSGESTGSGHYQTTRTCYAELEPFCGIHKIGNLAVQTFPRPAEEYRDMQMSTDEGDMFSLPSSSQDSNTSSFSSVNSHKRSYDSDVEDLDEDICSSTFFTGSLAVGGTWQDPLRLNPVAESLSTATTRSQRTILSPKLGQHRRRQFSSSFHSQWKRSSEQENKDPVSSVSNDTDMNDFEEASFLRRREEVDTDYNMWDGGAEVEMGGS
jgi:hypothetical protein